MGPSFIPSDPPLLPFDLYMALWGALDNLSLRTQIPLDRIEVSVTLCGALKDRLQLQLRVWREDPSEFPADEVDLEVGAQLMLSFKQIGDARDHEALALILEKELVNGLTKS